MSRLLLIVVAFLTLLAVAQPAEAKGPLRFRRQKVVAVVAPQPVYAAPVAIVQRQKFYAPAPIILAQPQIQYSQPIVVQQQSACYPQAQIIAPVVNGVGSSCFFSK